MRPGNLVQSNIFDPDGSGGYGLVLSRASHIGYWDVRWAGYKDELVGVPGGSYEVHEDDIVIVTTREE
jgi:hypothetical protein